MEKQQLRFINASPLLKQELNVGLAGNIGDSFAKQILEVKVMKIMCLEISSFQLDDIVDFKPKYCGNN